MSLCIQLPYRYIFDLFKTFFIKIFLYKYSIQWYIGVYRKEVVRIKWKRKWFRKTKSVWNRHSVIKYKIILNEESETEHFIQKIFSIRHKIVMRQLLSCRAKLWLKFWFFTLNCLYEDWEQTRPLDWGQLE